MFPRKFLHRTCRVSHNLNRCQPLITLSIGRSRSASSDTAPSNTEIKTDSTLSPQEVEIKINDRNSKVREQFEQSVVSLEFKNDSRIQRRSGIRQIKMYRQIVRIFTHSFSKLSESFCSLHK